MPQGIEEVDSPLVHVLGHPRVGRIEVTGNSIRIQREDRDGGVRRPFLVFGAQVVLELVVGTTEQPQPVPAPGAGAGPQPGCVLPQGMLAQPGARA